MSADTLAAWLRENARSYYVQNVMDGEEAGILTADATQWADDFEEVLSIMLDNWRAQYVEQRDCAPCQGNGGLTCFHDNPLDEETCPNQCEGGGFLCPDCNGNGSVPAHNAGSKEALNGLEQAHESAHSDSTTSGA